MLQVDKKDKNKVYVVDFDDFCHSTVGELRHLEVLKEKYPEFKVTLFTIPHRTTDKDIKKVKDMGDWVALAPHGYYHTRGECMGWTFEEALVKIGHAKERGIDAPVFRAPAWLLDGDVYAAAKELDITLATHDTFRVPFKRRFPLGDVKEYVYNAAPLRAKWVRGVHGHMTPVSGNYIGDMIEDGGLVFRKGAKWVWPWEAYVVEDEEGVRR